MSMFPTFSLLLSFSCVAFIHRSFNEGGLLYFVIAIQQFLAANAKGQRRCDLSLRSLREINCEIIKSYLEKNIYMKILFFILIIGCIATGCGNDHQSTLVSTTQPEKYDLSKDTSVYSGEMKRFWLVHLMKGPNRNQDSTSRVKIQAAHIANIVRLAKEGKIVMAGPIGVENELQGIFLMNCKDSTEVENFVKTDTAVITGRLVMKYYPWWCEMGKYIFK